jgi:D-proline reductase (dithiol) PrdB
MEIIAVNGDVEKKYNEWVQIAGKLHPPFVEVKNETIHFYQLGKPLQECKVALVTGTGVHLKSQQPFNIMDHHGDDSYREIPNDTEIEELAVSHGHIDTDDGNKDPNCVFPLERLRELEREQVIGAVSEINYGFMGFIPDPTTLKEEIAPKVALKLKENKVDIVILTPGCWMCHRSVAIIQNAIERQEISTISITLKPDITLGVGVPRTAYLRFPLGNPMGLPFKIEQQRDVLVSLLDSIPHFTSPNEAIKLPIRWLGRKVI